MVRAATSIPEDWIPLLEKRVAELRRPSMSRHIALLIEDDLRAAGALPMGAEDDDALRAQVASAIAEVPGFRAEVADLVRSAKRRARGAA